MNHIDIKSLIIGALVFLFVGCSKQFEPDTKPDTKPEFVTCWDGAKYPVIIQLDKVVKFYLLKHGDPLPGDLGLRGLAATWSGYHMYGYDGRLLAVASDPEDVDTVKRYLGK